MKTDTQESYLRPEADVPVGQPSEIGNALPPSPRSRLLEPFRDSIFGIGLLMLLVSASVFLLYDLLSDPRQKVENNAILIMLHYGIALTFSLILWTNGFLKNQEIRDGSGRPTRWLGLLIWLISAYALNREMAVFQQSTEWLCWVLVIVGAAMVLYAWKDGLSIRVQQLLYAVLAFGWWLFAYMALYIVGLYPVSFPLMIGLGLSAHTFVPLAFAISLGKVLWQDSRQEEHLRLGVYAGLTVPILAVGFFLSGWIGDVTRIEQTRQEATLRKTSDLPDWVLIAQQLKPGWITNRLLLSNRVYDLGRFLGGMGWGLGGLTALDDVRQHDPLVVISSNLCPADVLPDADQLSLIKTVLAKRHGTEEKFWTGRHLTTEDVVSQVRIWPQFRLSYTEQTIRIRNQARGRTEEALLTFHLPAGSVVSSMSLWVNGKEEPARLTTVAKADTAYRTVVGVESHIVARDPSVVFWQEGNRVTVRVFPCQAGADRRVKVGITSPLRLENTTLVYQNPTLEGPNSRSADELVSIDFTSAPTALETPWLLEKSTGNTITHRGHYDPNWTLRFDAPPLSAEPFVLDGRSYQLETYQPMLESFMPTDVFLDVNAEWSRFEFEMAVEAAKQRQLPTWVFADGLQQVTIQNLDALYDQLTRQSFSLFPVYRIANPATALLITKGSPSSPILSDLKGSRFAESFDRLSEQTAPIRTFCLSRELSPYLKTLAELRVLTVANGTSDDLIRLLTTARQFPKQPDTQDRIVLADAQVAIRERQTQDVNASVAPDHLARLFTYNHLLQQIGRHYFSPNYQTDALIQEAQRAHVVSPLSSLVVLETVADYNRFGIKKDALGLGNATLKEEGAVPEPHEWALLVMVLALIGWLYWRKRYAFN
ncbi:hypothetical protein BH09BAC4_BH09BAC4_06970 [soil metagenome]